MNESNKLIGKMQKVMDLRAKGYIIDFDFPSIAVIGSQSSGKSSVIESIVGRHLLPRGTNMITRCPIVMNLYNEVNCPNDYAIFSSCDLDDNPQPIEDFTKVRDEIVQRTHKIVRGRYGVSDTCIVVNIHSEKYPDNLQLIDLPGFVRNPVADQPADIKEQIEKLVNKYIVKNNTIILAVSDAMVDMAESAGIAESRKVDEKGLRTIGVLTKLDILSKEKIKDVLDTLSNKLLPLAKGYVGVINSSTDNAEEDIVTFRNKEMDMFRNSPFGRNVRNLGMDYLQSKLSKELSQKIREKIPDLIARVNEELDNSQAELDFMGYRDEDDRQPITRKLVDKVKLYESSVTVMLGGNDSRVSHEKIQGGALLKNLLKKEMKAARDEAMKLNPAQFGNKIEVMLYNLDATFDNILPNSIAFGNCVAILVEKFKRPFTNLINLFTEQLNIHLRKCAEETLSQVPNLKQKVIDVTTEKVFEFREQCKADMNRHIDIQKYFINTGHPEFKRYHNLINGIKTNILPVNKEKDVEEFHDAQSPVDGHKFEFEDDAIDKNITWIKERATAFCQFQQDIGENPARLAVPISTNNRKDFFLDIVLAYMLILETTLCHTGLKLVMYHLIHNVIEYHESHDLYVQLLENEESKIEEYLEIDSFNREKLEAFLQQRVTCKEVLKVLRDSN